MNLCVKNLKINTSIVLKVKKILKLYSFFNLLKYVDLQFVTFLKCVHITE